MSPDSKIIRHRHCELIPSPRPVLVPDEGVPGYKNLLQNRDTEIEFAEFLLTVVPKIKRVAFN